MKGKARLRVQDRNCQSIHDTYYNQSSPKDRSYCKKCHAIYHNKHWYFSQEEVSKLIKSNSATAIQCPACKKIEDNYPSGVVILKGGFLKGHKEEILNLIWNEEKKAKGLNPLERIIEISPLDEGFQVTTTHEKLAQRIGKSLHKAFNGNVAYQWLKQDKMARVSWDRE